MGFPPAFPFPGVPSAPVQQPGQPFAAPAPFAAPPAMFVPPAATTAPVSASTATATTAATAGVGDSSGDSGAHASGSGGGLGAGVGGFSFVTASAGPGDVAAATASTGSAAPALGPEPSTDQLLMAALSAQEFGVRLRNFTSAAPRIDVLATQQLSGSVAVGSSLRVLLQALHNLCNLVRRSAWYPLWLAAVRVPVSSLCVLELAAATTLA